MLGMFWEYLISRWRLLLSFAGCIGLFLLVCGLSHLPLGPVVYASTLSAAVGCLLLFSRFPAYWRRRALLKGFLKNYSEFLPDFLEPGDPLERDYQELARLLNRIQLRQKEGFTQRESEARQYFTLWAHQVKTPLSAIRLLAQEDGSVPKEELRQELFKTEQYVDMALQYLRLSRQEHDLVLSRFPLEELVRKAVKRTSALFIYKKVSLSLGDLSQTVATDEKWLVFVLEQLLTNAVKYTPPRGGVRIGLLPGKPCTLAVEDTGIGIHPEDIPRIFDWGYTGYNGRLDKHSTGIGLTLCRQALDLLGHTVSIRSEPGKGTAVLLNLSRVDLEIE